jgi:hypothetical protein
MPITVMIKDESGTGRVAATMTLDSCHPRRQGHHDGT